MVFELDHNTIVPESGINLDRGLSFGRHIDHGVEKTRKTTKALGTLLPNIKGPRENNSKH